MVAMSELDAPASLREVELKLAIGSPEARAAADREVGRAPVRSLETIYYDTPRRRLHGAGYSLRLRRDGEDWSQSVKAEAGFSRYENDRTLRGGLPDFSLLEGTPIWPLLDGEGALAPVFVTRVRRQSRRRDRDGGRIEYSLDDGEVIAHDRVWPILELELELKAGAPEMLFAEGRRLAADEAFVPFFMSKAERGFALADGLLGEPVRFGSQALSPDVSALAAFQTLARRCLRQLSLNAELIAGGSARLEAVHQARTALRRLRVAMGVFAGLLDPARLESLGAELKWLSGEFGPARNLDVLLLEIFQPRAEEVADRDGAAAFGQLLLTEQGRARERARAALASPRFRLLLLETARWIEAGPGLPGEADPPVGEFAAGALEQRRHALARRLKSLDWSDAVARHEARIAAKKMRYASEFFVGLGPKDRADRYRPFVKSLSELQDRLGGLNDVAVAEQMAPEILVNAKDAARTAYAAGLIIGRDLAAAERLTKKARRAGRTFLGAPAWW
jgi:inorganic triphosphatase YgiF